MLRGHHDVVLYAGGDARQLLEPAFAGTNVEVRPIPCPRFAYRSTGTLDLVRTGIAAVPYISRLGALVDRLARELRRDRVDLALVDFEPALPRAARRLGVPVLSLDHQHMLVESDLRLLPRRLRRHAAAMALLVRVYVPGARMRIVSSFFHPPLRRPRTGLIPVGVLLRPEVLSAEPYRGEHLTAYLRRSVPESVLEALAAGPRPVEVFGLGVRPPRGAVRFAAVSEESFVGSLARSTALVTTAGNQVVGEAIFLGKPVLAIPEPGNSEQEINAHLLAASGAGFSVPMAGLDVRALQELEARRELLAARCRHVGADGNLLALAAITSHLPDRDRRASSAAARRLADLRPAAAVNCGA